MGEQTITTGILNSRFHYYFYCFKRCCKLEKNRAVKYKRSTGRGDCGCGYLAFDREFLTLYFDSAAVI